MLAVVVDQPVVGNAVEPGGELGAHLVIGAGVDHAQPDVLVELFGEAGVPALVGEVAIEPRAVAGVEHVEGCCLTVAIGEHQTFIGAKVFRHAPLRKQLADEVLDVRRTQGLEDVTSRAEARRLRDEGTVGESAIATGAVEELTGEDKKQGLLLLIRKYSPGYVPEGLEYIEKLIDKTKVFRIRLDSITGKARV